MSVYVFGSINTDIIAKVRRIPNPGETMIAQSSITKPGGKGANQAVAAARAGSVVKMIGRLGQDLFADAAIENLSKNGIDTACVGRSAKASGVALINVDQRGENCIVVVPGANEDVVAADFKFSAFSANDALVLQMEVPIEESLKLLQSVKGKIKTKILNVAPFAKLPMDIYQYLDYLIVNEHEAVGIAKLLNMDYNLLPAKLAENIAHKIPCRVIVTNGAEGCYLASRDDVWHIPAMVVQPVDTTGAGDTFCGIFAALLEQGKTDIEAAKIASVGASLACLVEGAQDGMPKLDKIMSCIDQLPPVKKLATRLAG